MFPGSKAGLGNLSNGKMVHRNRKEKGMGGVGMEVPGGEGYSIYLSLHCHHQNDFCIKVGSDVSHFSNVSLISEGLDKGARQCSVFTDHNFSVTEEKGTEVPLSLTA